MKKSHVHFDSGAIDESIRRSLLALHPKIEQVSGSPHPDIDTLWRFRDMRSECPGDVLDHLTFCEVCLRSLIDRSEQAGHVLAFKPISWLRTHAAVAVYASVAAALLLASYTTYLYWSSMRRPTERSLVAGRPVPPFLPLAPSVAGERDFMAGRTSPAASQSEGPVSVSPSSTVDGGIAHIAAAPFPMTSVCAAEAINCSTAMPAPPVAAPRDPGPAAATAQRNETRAPVDDVIALLTSGMSESLVIDMLKSGGRTYILSPADLLKLQRAKVSEAIIVAMITPINASANAPAASVASRGAAGAPSAATVPSSAFPPDLPDVSTTMRKRRVAIEAFDYSTVAQWVNYWFSANTNIGEGIRSMLALRLGPSEVITMVERKNLSSVMTEQDRANANRFRRGTSARIGQLAGADVLLYGDIVIFGSDKTTRRKSLGAVLGTISPMAGAPASIAKEEKAVVGINLRLIDAQTGDQIDAIEARGESSRSSKDYVGLLGGKGAAVGEAGNMTSSSFHETMIGEATANAVSEIVRILESKLSQLPARPREIEGRVAAVGNDASTLALGSQDGVLRGDRFEIFKINGEIRDPVTKDVIDIDAVKVGELVVDTVRDRTATGRYGGEPLSASYVTIAGKGYAARLISK